MNKLTLYFSHKIRNNIVNDNFFTFIKVCGAPDTCSKLCSNLG